MPASCLWPLELPAGLLERPLPVDVQRRIAQSDALTQAFHDRRCSTSTEQFVASDHALVYRTLAWIADSQIAMGNRFIEWGSGLAVNACLAATLGWDVVAVEAEATLINEAQGIVALWQQPVELLHGNFLPPHSERLSDDPYLPSLGHPVPSVYEMLGLEIQDFDVVFAYPWPGEGDFIEEVFRTTAANGALLVCFRGPYEITVQQKRTRRRRV